MKNRIDDYLNNKENACRRHRIESDAMHKLVFEEQVRRGKFNPYRPPNTFPPKPNETLYDKGVLVAAVCMSLFMGFFFGLASGCFILAIM